MNALASPDVGDFLNTHFVATYERVATFKIVHGTKQGGNVASYFCEPDGRVIHALAGPVTASVFRREAKWVHDVRKQALRKGIQPETREYVDFCRRIHGERLLAEHGLDIGSDPLGAIIDGGFGRVNRQGRVHLLLAAHPLMKVDEACKPIFEKLLGEKISSAPVVVQERSPPALNRKTR